MTEEQIRAELLKLAEFDHYLPPLETTVLHYVRRRFVILSHQEIAKLRVQIAGKPEHPRRPELAWIEVALRKGSWDSHSYLLSHPKLGWRYGTSRSDGYWADVAGSRDATWQWQSALLEIEKEKPLTGNPNQVDSLLLTNRYSYTGPISHFFTGGLSLYGR